MNQSPYMTFEECAEYLRNVKVSTLKKWAWQKRIPIRKLHGKVVFHREDIDQWTASQSNASKVIPQSRFQDAKRRLRSLRVEASPVVEKEVG